MLPNTNVKKRSLLSYVENLPLTCYILFNTHFHRYYSHFFLFKTLQQLIFSQLLIFLLAYILIISALLFFPDKIPFL